MTVRTNTYDKNGNLISDANKQISSILYNHLNLRTKVTFSNGQDSVEYVYDASVIKVMKKSGENIKWYLGGLEYATKDEEIELEAIYHSEGRVVPSASPSTDGVVNWQYEYTISDHLGNARVSFTDSNGDGIIDTDTNNGTEILQTQSYYPFGLTHSSGSDVQLGPENKYQYNGKELQSELGWHHYGVRYYDSSIARWTTVDPLAESMNSWSPYNYTFDNPIRFIDPDGAAPDDITLKGANNSSVTIKTDLIDITVDGSNIVGDFGGNFTLEGDDILIAGLDIAGVIDPTGVADVFAAGLEFKNGNILGGILSGAGVFAYVGDLAKVGKISKHVKTIKNAIEEIVGTVPKSLGAKGSKRVKRALKTYLVKLKNKQLKKRNNKRETPKD